MGACWQLVSLVHDRAHVTCARHPQVWVLLAAPDWGVDVSSDPLFASLAWTALLRVLYALVALTCIDYASLSRVFNSLWMLVVGSVSWFISSFIMRPEWGENQ